MLNEAVLTHLFGISYARYEGLPEKEIGMASPDLKPD
jgi:hypothetical protein